MRIFVAALLLLCTACGASATNVLRICTPAYSENCLIVESYADRDGAEVEVTGVPDVSVSAESWLDGPRGINAAGAASFDPVSGEAEVSGCIDLLVWEACAEATTESDSGGEAE